jgi:hypothetical protein
MLDALLGGVVSLLRVLSYRIGRLLYVLSYPVVSLLYLLTGRITWEAVPL